MFSKFLFKFAKRLNNLSDKDGPLAQEVKAMAPDFLNFVLDNYALRRLGPCPAAPQDFQRPKCGCGCVSCADLDAFLADPTLQETQLHLDTQELAKHVKDQLPILGKKKADPGAPRNPEYETEMREREERRGWQLKVKKTTPAWEREKRK